MEEIHPSKRIIVIGDKYFGTMKEHKAVKYSLVAFNHNTVSLQNLTNPEHEVITIPRFYFVETFRHEKRPEIKSNSIDKETLFSIQSTVLATMKEIQQDAKLAEYDLTFIYNAIALDLLFKFNKK